MDFFPWDDFPLSNDTTAEFLELCATAAELEDSASSSNSRTYVDRDRQQAHENLMKDYFDEEPRYTDAQFRNRFRMSKELFLKIVNDVETNFPWFQQRSDARGKKGFSALQKCTAAIRQLAYGNVPESYDENLAMSARSSRECLQYFCNAIIILYRNEFLRTPTSHDIALIYQAHEDKHKIPGMLGSLDCTHWDWRNCPTEYRGQFHRGDHRNPTIILEAVGSNDLWIWHAFFGMAGSNNDINVLQQSSLFAKEYNGTAPSSAFVLRGRTYARGYYLADGIYPSWSVFVKSLKYPADEKEKKFAKLQESARKDVERAFGVLKAKWVILNRPARAMTQNKIASVMYACIILHNMIIKNEGRAISPVYIQDPPTEPTPNDNLNLELRNEAMYHRLRFDLMEHIWENPEINFPDDD